MNVNKILERNRFTALCGGCGEIFDYSTIDEVIFAHQGGPNCETPCPSCATGVLCACEYCQSLITDELKNAAAPVQVVPTPPESSRPDSQNADKLHYRHQSVIDSVFDIPFITSNPPFIVSVFDTELPMSDGYIGDVFYSSGDRISLTVVSDIADAFHFSDGSFRDSCIASLTAFGFFCQWSELEQSK